MANQGVHGTTQEAVAARGEAQQFRLQAMAERPNYSYVDGEQRKVPRDA